MNYIAHEGILFLVAEKSAPKRKSIKKSLRSEVPKYFDVDTMYLLSIVARIQQRVQNEICTNPKHSCYLQQIENLKKIKKKMPEHEKKSLSPKDIQLHSRKSGHGVSYYEAESIALCSDLIYTQITHNLDLFEKRVDSLYRELSYQYLQELVEAEKIDEASAWKVASYMGLLVDDIYISLPTHAERKYNLSIQIPAEDDYEELSEEVLECFEEDQILWEINGTGKRNGGATTAQLIEAGLLQEDVGILKM